jgi:AAA15 family ATPase/GTPase
MKQRLALQTARVKNFKAIQDSGEIKFTPLTVLIGSNGSGKSGLIEALETYQAIIGADLNGAFQRWRGFH